MKKFLNLCLCLIAVSTFICQIKSQDPHDLTKPHIVIMGQTGVGKSSLANALIGEDPRCTNCTFPVCHDMDSCTKETSYAVAPWLGFPESPFFTVVDTPGFGDSDEEMNDLIDEMMEVLNNDVKTTNSLLLLFKATENRFNSHLITMLRQMTALFGSSMWNSTMIGISFFPYDQDSIDKRNEECEAYPEFCRNEEFFNREINRQLNEKFDVGFNLPICFIDSWSQTVGHKDDPTEQLHYIQETAKLWNFSTSENEFVFKTIDDILVENDEMRKMIGNLTMENQRLNDIISENIRKLQKCQVLAQGYKCYHWSAKDQTQIRRLGGSIRSERITCEGYENFVFTQGDDSKACGCGGCYCCQPNNN